MHPIIAWFAARGLSEPAARIAAWVAGAVALLAILGLLAGAWRVFDWWDDRAAIEAAVNKANVKALATARAADDRAAEQAAADDRVIGRQLEETIDVIENAKGGGAGSARVAHNCQRLRRHGFAEADLPAACRDPAPAGSQARPDR